MYEQGFENVITVGNDTPHLKSCQLSKTAKLLETEKIVLGPSTDGGYYLMGLHKSQFNKNIFLKLPWQTSRLTQSIARLVAVQRNNIIFLETLQDIDTVVDVRDLLNGFRKITTSLRKILRTIVSNGVHFFSVYNFNTSSFQKKSPFNKGSPLSV